VGKLFSSFCPLTEAPSLKPDATLHAASTNLVDDNNKSMDPRPSTTVLPLSEEAQLKYCSPSFMTKTVKQHSALGPSAPDDLEFGVLSFFPPPGDLTWQAFAATFVPPTGLLFDGTYNNFVGILLYAIVSCVPQAKTKLKGEQDIKLELALLSSRSSLCKTEFEEGARKSFESVFTAVFLGKIGPVIAFLTTFVLQSFGFRRPQSQSKFSLNPESVSILL
jgi:hypothetical protein